MKHLLVFALLLILVLPAASQPAPSDIVPLSDPAFHSADVLQKAGIVFGDPNGGNGRRVLTRSVFAAATAEVMREVEGYPPMANQLAASPSALVALKALVVEFTPELTAMKKNVVQYQSTLAALTARHPLINHPFSDVPPDHWAAAAVETLRQRGIVDGYPAGTYRTK